MLRRGARVTLLSLLLAGTVAAAFVVITGERRAASILPTATQGLDDVIRAQLGAELAAIARVRWIALGVMATLLVAGLFALTPISRAQPLPEPGGSPSPTVANPETEPAPEPSQPPTRERDVDLASVARLCTDLSRVATTDALPDLLGRSAVALDASGLIVWVGVGDRLLPVMGHGYPAQTIARIGPAARADDTAAATAWRTGERVIVSGAPGSAGAVVVPLLGVDMCVGVLAFEVPHGREHDPVTHAVAGLIAAQLATVVPAPPAESPREPLADSLIEPGQESQAQSA